MILLVTICPQNSALAISSGENWWQTVLEREISWSQWEGLARTQWALIFHFGGRGGVTGIFCFLLLFPMCSHQVTINFPSSHSVPKCIPQDVPNSTPVLSHMECPKFIFPV
jgi:hypothetical protein